MYRVDKENTPASRVNETWIALKEFRACFTKNDLSRMFYENFFEDSIVCEVLNMDVEAMPIFEGYSFSIDMVIKTFNAFEEIHFWIDETEKGYSINNEIMERRVYTLTKNF